MVILSLMLMPLLMQFMRPTHAPCQFTTSPGEREMVTLRIVDIMRSSAHLRVSRTSWPRPTPPWPMWPNQPVWLQLVKHGGIMATGTACLLETEAMLAAQEHTWLPAPCWRPSGQELAVLATHTDLWEMLLLFKTWLTRLSHPGSGHGLRLVKDLVKDVYQIKL